jgi:hypothetical protein
MKPGLECTFLRSQDGKTFTGIGSFQLTTTRRAVLAGSGLLTSAALLGDIPTTAAQPVEAGAAPEPAAAPLETAVEAYIYGYPLVTMEMTRRVMTNTEKAGGVHAPMGQFANVHPDLPPAPLFGSRSLCGVAAGSQVFMPRPASSIHGSPLAWPPVDHQHRCLRGAGAE